MEWVETTGKTVEEAKDAALDQLGVDEQDAEFEVVEEPRTGLFGRTPGRGAGAGPGAAHPAPAEGRAPGPPGPVGRSGRPDERRRTAAAAIEPPRRPRRQRPRPPSTDAAEPAPRRGRRPPRRPTAGGDRAAPPAAQRRAAPRRPRPRRPRPRRPIDDDDEQESRDMTETELAEQGEVVRGFLVDLLDAFGLDGDVTATPAEEGAVELAVAGDDLGLLIGPKGATLQAVQELSRSVLQRTLPGRGPRPHPGRRRRLPGPPAGGPRGLRPQGRRGRGRLRRPEGARADGPARPQGRPRHRERDRRRAHGVRGRGRPPPGRHHPRLSCAQACCSGRPHALRRPASRLDAAARCDELRARSGLLEQLERARTLGFLGPGPVEPHIDHAAAFLTALRGRPGTVVDLGSGGGVPGLVARRWPDRTSHLVLVEARAKRCRFLEAAVEALGVDRRGGRGAGRGGRALGARGGRPMRWSPGASALPAATAECASPLLRVGGRLVVSEPPPPPQPDRWPAAGLRRLGLEATERVADGHRRPGARAADRRARTPTPGGTASRPSGRCSDDRGVPRGTRVGRSVDPRSRVPRGTSRTVLAPHAPTGQDAAVTESQDDLASRGRAIFQRLRGGEPPTPEPPATTGGSADGRRSRLERRRGARRPRTPPALTDEELEAFTAPPPPDRPDPADPPARGPLPGLEDLPPLAEADGGAPDLEAPPIYVPLDGRRGEPPRSDAERARTSPSRRTRARRPSPGRSPGSWRSPTRRAASARPPRP